MRGVSLTIWESEDREGKGERVYIPFCQIVVEMYLASLSRWV